MFSTRSARWAALAVLATASQFTAQTAAHADDTATAPGKKIVVLGDSFAANPPYQHWDDPNVCHRGADSWPNQLGALTGVAGTDDFVDESCSGATIDTGAGYNMIVQSKLAAADGAFGPDTQLVAVQVGIAESWRDGTNPFLDYVHDAACYGTWGSTKNCMNNDQSWLTDTGTLDGAGYAGRIGKVVDYVRYYAPNARIVLLGYPEEFAPGSTNLCTQSDMLPGLTFPKRNDAIAHYLDRLDSAQRDAAQQLGVEFMDVRAITAGHDGCSADPWVGDATPIGTIEELHPRDGGNKAVAQALAARVAGN
ncbi:SGNH/GDSL hydrolase family protein [Nocardia stercoris]|nr:SGNH/GDSL hydrolase family protein [Nocardia stercoris]